MATAYQTATPTSRVHVRSGSTTVDTLHLVFDRPFTIGRVEECDVCIRNGYVSRQHAEVLFENGYWWIRDLGSSNGVYVNGERVEVFAIEDTLEARLGVEGPILWFYVEQPPPPPVAAAPAVGENTMVLQYIDRYFGKDKPDSAAGEHTMYVRRAFAQVQAKQKKSYRKLIAGLALLILAIAGFAFYEHQQVRRQTSIAENIFYSMKALDVEIANLQTLVIDSHSQAGAGEIRKFQERRAEMEKNYDQFLTTLHVHDQKMTPQQQITLRMARVFGECELDMPKEFETEVNNYIKKWQSSSRLANAVRLAKEKGYTQQIAQEFLANDLPPQFFYLALQESNFDPYISGPPTRKGIAKGMWQFIPETAVKYGMHVGPLVDFARPDPGDDRHHWDVETKAATRYIKELYGSDAQASGLLVMACYNWGEDYVLPLVRSMPLNPRERNFWKLLTKYRDKIPQQTYDYVFYITSAAVIGENPRLFGFDFDNPLGTVQSK